MASRPSLDWPEGVWLAVAYRDDDRSALRLLSNNRPMPGSYEEECSNDEACMFRVWSCNTANLDPMLILGTYTCICFRKKALQLYMVHSPDGYIAVSRRG